MTHSLHCSNNSFLTVNSHIGGGGFLTIMRYTNPPTRCQSGVTTGRSHLRSANACPAAVCFAHTDNIQRHVVCRLPLVDQSRGTVYLWYCDQVTSHEEETWTQAASGAVGPSFKSQPRRCRVTVLGKLFTPIVPLFIKQRNW